MQRRLALVLLPAVALGLAAAPSLAAPPKKPIKGSYTVGPLTPDPTPIATGTICAPINPGAIDARAIKFPSAGTLKVDLDDFTLDWALGLRDEKGGRLAESDGGTPETDETMTVKIKKGATLTIEACNFAGSPTATVNYVFTPK